MVSFEAGRVIVEVIDGVSDLEAVPPGQWRGDRQPRVAKARTANIRASDGLRARVYLAEWPDDGEVSLGHAEILAGPADYERLEDAGLISPKRKGDQLVARIRALSYERAERARGVATTWEQIDEWAGTDAQAFLRQLGATATGEYGVLLPGAARFKAEPAIEVPLNDPRALFAVYALTRVTPIMLGHGRPAVEGPNN